MQTLRTMETPGNGQMLFKKYYIKTWSTVGYYKKGIFKFQICKLRGKVGTEGHRLISFQGTNQNGRITWVIIYNTR